MASPSYIQRAQKLIADNDFLMISKSWCPDCVYAHRVWKDVGVADKVHLVELDKLPGVEGPELQKAFLELTNQNTVPNIFFKRKHMGGEVQLEKMEKSGQLIKELKAAQLL
ncbi:thioredoxin-like protein [Nadsonia fulvescens var. elongata DSM 6958]|uniref:Thioredoxin-like protein n=1 Tax=Nadsonia fulvescens var. elongata DSM 6958 TaxID=857566 RepID=A0A1E3PRF1_9ASCO|nr:thioredoxin-like protein [Nadsonia fulvescens var. elongata DSM 6958]